MPHILACRLAIVAATVVAPMLLAACNHLPATPPATAPATPSPTPAPVTRSPVTAPPPPVVAPVTPVEAEPWAPAAQPQLLFTQITQGPLAAILLYADKVRPLGGNEASAEVARLGDPGDAPFTQMQVALALAQTRNPPDLARALGMLQRIGSSTQPEAQPLQPLARVLAARYAEQRRIEDDRDRQVQQLRESQKKIDQLNDRIEALRAIERSFARPANGNNAAPRPAP